MNPISVFPHGGQTNYETYSESVQFMYHNPLPAWATLTQAEKDAWQEAAELVIYGYLAHRMKLQDDEEDKKT